MFTLPDADQYENRKMLTGVSGALNEDQWMSSGIDLANGPAARRMEHTTPLDIANLSSESTMENILGQRAAYFWTMLLVVGFLVLDLLLPLGVAAGVPYAVAVMVSARTSNSRFIWATTSLATLLTIGGFALSPDGGEQWHVIANRTLAVMVIVGTGVFTTAALRSRERTAAQVALVEQAKLQEVARDRATEIRSEFLVQISHELRTPLTSLTTFANLLANKSETLSPERIKDHSEVIGRSGRRLEVLINDLIDASVSETGNFVLSRSRVDIPQIVADTVKDYGLQLEARKQNVIEESRYEPGENRHANADAIRISQIVTNLLANASKYSWMGSDIAVTCALEREHHVVKIVDTGEGIDAGELPEVFEPFFRGDTDYVRSVPGAGLGLTIARAITQLHGGTLAIESERGSGTTVTLKLPVFAD